VCASIPMIFEPFFSIPVVVIAPVAATPVVGTSDMNVSVPKSLVIVSHVTVPVNG
jgi:hypothetical protein